MNQVISSELYYKQTVVEDSIKKANADKIQLSAQLSAKRHELEMIKKQYEESLAHANAKNKEKDESRLFKLRNLQLNLWLAGVTTSHFIVDFIGEWNAGSYHDFLEVIETENLFKLQPSAVREVADIVRNYRSNSQEAGRLMKKNLTDIDIETFSSPKFLQEVKEKVEGLSFKNIDDVRGDEEVSEYLKSHSLKQLQIDFVSSLLFDIFGDCKKFRLTKVKEEVLELIGQRLNTFNQPSKISNDKMNHLKENLIAEEKNNAGLLSMDKSKNDSGPKFREHKNDDNGWEDSLFNQNETGPNYGEEEEKAAVKIQKVFKGSKQRKEYIQRKGQVHKHKHESNHHRNNSSNENDPHSKKQNSSHRDAKELNSNKKEKMSRITVTASNKKESKPANQPNTIQQTNNSHSKSNVKKDHSEKHFYESDGNDEFEESGPQQKSSKFANEEHQAAIKIQSVYRGRKVRQEMQSIKGSNQNMFQKEQSDNAISNKNFDEEEQKAATKIQARYRGIAARKKVNQLKQNNRQVNRKDSREQEPDGFDREESCDDAIDNEEDDEAQKEMENKAAIKIQSRYKGVKQRKEFQELKMKKEKEVKQASEPEMDFGEEEHKAATKIQSRFKGVKQRKEYENLKQQKATKSPKKIVHEMQIGLAPEDDEHKAAIKIQSVYKGNKQRKQYQSLKKTKVPDVRSVQLTAKPNFDQEEHEAATKIQKFYKAKKQKELIQDKKATSKDQIKTEAKAKSEPDFGEEEHRAATKIQSVYKGKKERKQYQSRKQAEIERIEKELQELEELDSQLLEQEKAAIKIQSAMRGKMQRRKYDQLKQQKKNAHPIDSNNKPESHFKEENDEHLAATKIQSVYKGKKARAEFNKKREQMNMVKEESESSEFNIQSNHEHQNNHESNKAISELDQKDQEKAAVKIQSLYRGNRDRDHVKKLKDQKKDDTRYSGMVKPVQSPNQYLMEQFDKIDINEIKPKTQEANSPLENPADDNEAQGHNLKKNYKGYLSKKKLEPRVNSSENIKSVSSSHSDKHLNKKASVKKSRDVMPIYDARTDSIKNSQAMTHRVSKSALIQEKRKRASRTVNEFSELHKKTNEDGNCDGSDSEKSFSIPDGKVHFYERQDEQGQNQAPRNRQSKINFREKIDEAKKNSSKKFDANEQIIIKEQIIEQQSERKDLRHQPTEPTIHEVVDAEYNNIQDDLIKQSMNEPTKIIPVNNDNPEAKEETEKSYQNFEGYEDHALFFASKDLVRSMFKKAEKKQLRNSQNMARPADVPLYGPVIYDPTANEYSQAHVTKNESAFNGKYTSLAKDIDSRIVNSNRINESKVNEQAGLSILPAGIENETDYELRTNESRSSIGHGGGELSVTVKRLTPSGVNVQGNMLRISLEDNDYKIQSLQSESFPTFRFIIEKQKFVLFEIVKAGDACYSRTFPLEGLLFTERSVVVETLEFFIEQQSVFLDIEFEWIANVDTANEGVEYEPPNFQFDDTEN